MKPKVYIDGREGTTGLGIYGRLERRSDIELLLIPEKSRKNIDERKKYLNEADLVFLCLPDVAANEAIGLIDNHKTKVIDASTAHRTSDGWTYGFPELGLSEDISKSNRVANPGCHATGFLSIVMPLVSCKVIHPDYMLPCYSISGYSGGGKKMILKYESPNHSKSLDAPRIYALDMNHKHIPEMMKIAGLKAKPIFTPIVSNYYRGMATTVMLENRELGSMPSAGDIRDILAAYYLNQRLINVNLYAGTGNVAVANELADTNYLHISVYGDESMTVVTAKFDNLGKGASGAAVQNMNLMLGFDECEGLLP